MATAHIGRMSGDAMWRGAEHGVDAVVAIHRGAAGTGLAFVAGVIDVAKVKAARALQEIPAGGGHIA